MTVETDTTHTSPGCRFARIYWCLPLDFGLLRRKQPRKLKHQKTVADPKRLSHVVVSLRLSVIGFQAYIGVSILDRIQAPTSTIGSYFASV